MVKMASMDPTMVLGTRLCEQLGIDPNKVRSVAFRACVGEQPLVTVEIFPDNPDDELGVLRHYRITAVEADASD